MNVGKPRTRTKLPLEAKHGDAVGRVVLAAKALPKPVQYRWQMSTDQKEWTDLTENFTTKTTVEDLVSATRSEGRAQEGNVPSDGSLTSRSRSG